MFKMGCSMAKKILAIDGKGSSQSSASAAAGQTSGAQLTGTGSDSAAFGSSSKKPKDKQTINEANKAKATSGDELNDFSKLEADPRIPLSVRQIFKITKSWKAIARTMSKTGTAMFLNLFEQNRDLFYLFDRFQHLKGTELHESMELREHAATVMSTLDRSINSLSDYDNFVAYLHSIGKLHRKVPGFVRAHFWVSRASRTAIMAAAAPVGGPYRIATKPTQTTTCFNNISLPRDVPSVVSASGEQKIEQPFLMAVKQTLDERCNESIEEIYKIAIKLIIETIADGYGEDQPASAREGAGHEPGRTDDTGGAHKGASDDGSGPAATNVVPNNDNKSAPIGQASATRGMGAVDGQTDGNRADNTMTDVVLHSDRATAGRSSSAPIGGRRKQGQPEAGACSAASGQPSGALAGVDLPKGALYKLATPPEPSKQASAHEGDGMLGKEENNATRLKGTLFVLRELLLLLVDNNKTGRASKPALTTLSDGCPFETGFSGTSNMGSIGCGETEKANSYNGNNGYDQNCQPNKKNNNSKRLKTDMRKGADDRSCRSRQTSCYLNSWSCCERHEAKRRQQMPGNELKIGSAAHRAEMSRGRSCCPCSGAPPTCSDLKSCPDRPSSACCRSGRLTNACAGPACSNAGCDGVGNRSNDDGKGVQLSGDKRSWGRLGPSHMGRQARANKRESSDSNRGLSIWAQIKQSSSSSLLLLLAGRKRKSADQCARAATASGRQDFGSQSTNDDRHSKANNFLLTSDPSELVELIKMLMLALASHNDTSSSSNNNNNSSRRGSDHMPLTANNNIPTHSE